MSENVCRLCRKSTDNLMCVFDNRMLKNTPEIIRVTTGVEICRSDKITQMVCDTCYKISIRMHQFRILSIKHDNDLKAKYTAAITNFITPNSENTVEIVPPPVMKSLPTKCQMFVHPSVKEVLHKYPKLIIPKNCLKLHIGAYITLQTDEVDKWYKEENLSDDKIAAIKQEAGKRALAEEKFNREMESRKRRQTIPKSREITKKPARFVNASVEPEMVYSSASVSAVTSKKAVSPTKNLAVRVVRKNIQVSDNSLDAKNVISKQTFVKEKKPVSKQTSHKLVVKNDNKTILSLLPKKRDNLQQANNNSVLAASLKSSKPINKQVQDDAIEIRSVNLRPSSVSNTLRKISVDRPYSAKTDQIKAVTNEINTKSISDDNTILRALDRKCSNDSTNLSATNKTTFMEALDLVPENNNISDLSLLSVSSKSQTFYICKVCNSRHSSLKQLRYHKKKIHFKRPLCKKRFRSLRHFDKHFKTSFLINRGLVKTKPFNLELTRVDKRQKLKKKNASSFKDIDEKHVKDIPHEEVSKTTKQNESKNDDTELQPQNSNKKMIKIVNKEILKNINVNHNNSNIMKQILQFSKYNKSNTKKSLSSLDDYQITNGNSNRVKVFKNLHRHLNKFKIFVQIKNSSKLSAKYVPNKFSEPKKLNKLWYNTTSEQLQKMNCCTNNEEKKPNSSMVNNERSNHTQTAVQQTSNTVILHQVNTQRIIPAAPSNLMTLPSLMRQKREMNQCL